MISELFPDADFEFSMRLRPGDPLDFFKPTPDTSSILRERTRWLKHSPERCVVLDPNHGGLLAPLLDFAAATGQEHLLEGDPDDSSLGGSIPRILDLSREPEPRKGDIPVAPDVESDGKLGDRNVALPLQGENSLRQLGRRWEPDFLVVSPDSSGRFVLRAGCVCFPSGWAPEEKLGLPMEAIHGVVPGLNAAIGAKIHQFLARLKPGAGWYRSNWGVSSSPEFNQHPQRAVNRLTRDTSPGTTWLRLEHQVLTRLPDGDAVLFGIRLQNVSMKEARADPTIRPGLRRALATLPDELAAYKNLTAARPALIEYLEQPRTEGLTGDSPA